MTYGSPESMEKIPAYLKNIRGGREPGDALIEEFRRRYLLIGGSPLVSITRAQAAALEAALNQTGDGRPYKEVAGMRFSDPSISDVVAENAPSSGRVVGIIMSPQYSPTIMSGYISALEHSVSDLHRTGLAASIAKDWHMQPFFLRALAERIREALDRFPTGARGDVQVLLTAHSMPKRVIEKEPGYIDDLKETAAAVAELAGLSKDRWTFCYQSAGHTQEEWLKPDFADVIPELRRAGHRRILVAPVQFLADHLEILYDIEIGARQQAEALGMEFARIESLNISTLFIRGLVDVVQDTLNSY
jgi:ferrochelatase